MTAQLRAVTGSSIRPQQDIRFELLAGLEMQHDAGVPPFHRRVLFVVSQECTAVAQVITERIADFVVEILK